jgi:hypothetical protein
LRQSIKERPTFIIMYGQDEENQKLSKSMAKVVCRMFGVSLTHVQNGAPVCAVAAQDSKEFKEERAKQAQGGRLQGNARGQQASARAL